MQRTIKCSMYEEIPAIFFDAPEVYDLKRIENMRRVGRSNKYYCSIDDKTYTLIKGVYVAEGMQA